MRYRCLHEPFDLHEKIGVLLKIQVALTICELIDYLSLMDILYFCFHSVAWLETFFEAWEIKIQHRMIRAIRRYVHADSALQSGTSFLFFSKSCALLLVFQKAIVLYQKHYSISCSTACYIVYSKPESTQPPFWVAMYLYCSVLESKPYSFSYFPSCS